MNIPRLLLGALTLVAIPFTACTQSTGGGTGASTIATSVCSGDSRAQDYAVGLSATTMDGKMKATFVDAMPAPPVKGENTWIVKLTDAQGNPVSGAAVAVLPWMPDHGHGSSITPQVMPMDTDGTYQVTLLEFFMAGIWQTTLTVTPSGGAPEAMVFTFCVDG